MRIRRDIPNGAGVEARESSRTRASKAAVLRSELVLRVSSAGAVSSGEEWSRPKVGRGSPLRVSLRREFTVPS